MRVEKNIEQRGGKYRVYIYGAYKGTYDTLEQARQTVEVLKSTHVPGKHPATVRGFTERLNNTIWRSNKDMSEISQGTGITRSVLWSYQNGTLPKADNLARLAKYLDVSTDWLLGLKGKNNESEGTGNK